MSIRGYEWIFPKQEIDDPLEWIKQSRGMDESFFDFSYDDVYSKFDVYGAKKAAETIIQAIKKKKKIFIHGDFDVDGITATSIMWRFLFRDLNADAIPYVPSRFDEGYGLSDDSIQSIIDQGGELIITVDCGIKDLDIVEKYKDKIDFIISDHHTIISNKPEKENYDKVGEFYVSKFAKAVVHPKLGDPEYMEICGANVSWKLCSAINEVGKFGIDMSKYIDLVALGTVCDIMPLVGENRTLTALGIEQMNSTQNMGLKALIDSAAIEKVTTYHLGYVLGPRLNASGRISHAMDGVKLLCTDNYSAALGLAENLAELNTERQNLTKKYLELAQKQIDEQGDRPFYFVYGDEWPEGIVGLISGRLTQNLYRPTLVGSKSGEKIKGSARSIEEVNIASALQDSSQYLEKFGGHSQAAGFTLNSSALSDFIKSMEKYVNSAVDIELLKPKFTIDAKIKLEDANIPFIQSISRMEPFGNKNTQPLFHIKSEQISPISFIGKDKTHIKFSLRNSGMGLDVIGFNFAGYLKNKEVNSVEVIGYLDINEWNGNRTPQLRLVDLKI